MQLPHLYSEFAFIYSAHFNAIQMECAFRLVLLPTLFMSTIVSIQDPARIEIHSVLGYVKGVKDSLSSINIED